MLNQKGVEVVQVAIVVIFVGFLISLGYDLFSGDSSNAQKAASIAAENYVKHNGIEAKQIRCAQTADRDGYALCKILTQNGEHITLDCPAENSDHLECEETII